MPGGLVVVSTIPTAADIQRTGLRPRGKIFIALREFDPRRRVERAEHRLARGLARHRRVSEHHIGAWVDYGVRAASWRTPSMRTPLSR